MAVTHRNVMIKSTLRQPVRTIFLVIIFGLISFAFVSRATEYLVVQRETERLGSFYRSIGRLVTTKPSETWDVSRGAEVVKNSPYVAFEDRQRFTSGIMQGVFNADTDGTFAESSSLYSNEGVTNTDFWFYAKLSSKEEIDTKIRMREPADKVGYVLTFDRVEEVLAGHPEFIQQGAGIKLGFYFDGHEDAIPTIEAMQVGQRYLIRGWYDWYLNFSLNLKGMYNLGPMTDSKLIRPLDDASLWYLPVAPGAEVDFTDPGLAYVKNELDILQQNTHALFARTTADMSALPDAQPSSRFYTLLEGRWLDRQDDLEGHKVIAISAGLARARKLKPGDSLTLVFRPIKQPNGAYIQVEEDRQNWRTYPTYQETFTIVGIYDSEYTMGTFGYNNVFIPNSTLPAGLEYTYNELDFSRYSFVLKSPRDQDAFLAETKAELAQYGIFAAFVDNKGKAFWAGVDPLRRSLLVGLIIFGLVLLLALALAVYLYLTQRRRDYAILRSMGVPKAKANRQLLLSMSLVGLPGILAGGTLAWGYALGRAETELSNIPTPAGILPSASLSPLYPAAFCAAIFLLLFTATWFGARLIALRPVLALLQGDSAPVIRKREPQGIKQTRLASTFASETPPAAVASAPSPVLIEALSFQKSSQSLQFSPLNRGALVRYGLRQATRARFRSLLAIAVAAGFVLGLGWMQWTQERTQAYIDRLYDTTVVKAQIFKSLPNVVNSYGEGIVPRKYVDDLLKLGFFQNTYLEAGGIRETLDANYEMRYEDKEMEIRGVYEPEVFFADTLQGARVEYTPGWDQSLFTEDWNTEKLDQQPIPTLFPQSWMERLGLKLGDTISFANWLDKKQYRYLVAGKYSGVQLTYYETILVPGAALEAMDGDALRYAVARFTVDPARNRELATIKAEAEAIVSHPQQDVIPLMIVFWDEDLTVVATPLEKSLSLLRVLYPLTVAVSVLIGAGLCLLLALQRARDAALLRMLGVTRTRVRVLLSSEQILLSIMGLLLGLGLLAVLRQDIGAILTGSMGISAGLYLLGALLGSLVGATLVSNRKPLDLLQVKE